MFCRQWLMSVLFFETEFLQGVPLQKFWGSYMMWKFQKLSGAFNQKFVSSLKKITKHSQWRIFFWIISQLQK